MANLLHHFAAAVERHPDGIAIVDAKGRETGFQQLKNRAHRLAAHWHAKGVQKGDRVLLAMPVNADLYASLAALWSLGATVVLPEPAMGLTGLRHAACTTNPTAYCASGWYRLLKFLLPELRTLTLLQPRETTADYPTIDPADTDIALISFTSGTTGKPKAIPRSHGFLMAQHDAIAPLMHSDEPERDLVAFPVFTLINIASGRCSVLPNWKMRNLQNLTPSSLTGWMETQQVTRALLPPSICATLSKGEIPKKLHTIFTGGGPVFPDIVQSLQRGNDLRIVSVYGSTEAEPIAHLNAGNVSPRDAQDMATGKGLLVGRPVEHIEVRIQDDEIQVAGGHVNSGYLDPGDDVENKIPQGDKTWHRTGDAGAFDDQGRLWLWGRVGSDVLTADTRLYPFSIEVAARYWKGVEHSALMAVDGAVVLMIQGDGAQLDNWNSAARGFGVNSVRLIAKIPMDARHGSKIDRKKLAALLR